MKLIVLLADGLGGEAHADLGGKTPLEAAKTPTLDHLAARGILGLTRVMPPGTAPDPEAPGLALLGYDPTKHCAGRGALEALGRGTMTRPSDLMLCCDLVTLGAREDGTVVLQAMAGGVPDPDVALALGRDLAAAVSNEALALVASPSPRQLVVWHGGEARVKTTPPWVAYQQPVEPLLPVGPGADLLRDVARHAAERLERHPACDAMRGEGRTAPNAVWLWGPGTAGARVPSLATRAAMPGAVVASTTRGRGLGVLAGLRPVDVPAPADLADVAGAVGRALAQTDLCFVHVAPFDVADHPPSMPQRAAVLERLDQELVAPVLGRLRECGDDWRVLCLVSPFGRAEEPLPFLVYVAADEAKARGQERRFQDRDARDQGIFIPEAHELMERLLRR